MKVCTLIGLCAAAVSAQNTGTWSRFASLKDARFDACAVALSLGQVLITGGTGVNGPLASAEILSSDGTVRPAHALSAVRARHTCTMLSDGRVLVTGGGPASAEVYDPKADVWAQADGNGIARTGATATLLADGRVLIAGGLSNGSTAAAGRAGRHRAKSIPGAPVAALEIFDPVANLLLLGGADLQYPRSGHAAARLADGRVAIVGGDSGAGPLRSVEIFDPVTNSVAAGPDLNIARSGHSATALEDGRVLVAGGNSGILETDAAEMLDGTVHAWTTLAHHLNTARTGHFSLLVPGNGGVLLAGGSGGGQALASTELFQPADDSFQPLGNLTAPRSAMTGAALADGMVLAMGGATSGIPQSACGVLPLPALSFTAALYHPSETVRVSGSNFPVNTTLPLILEEVQGSTATSISTRLLTPTVVTGNGTLLSGFGAVPVVNVAGGDAGQQFRVTIRLTSTASVVRSVPAKLATSISIPLPSSVLEGGSATFPIEVQRFTLPGPVGGSLTTTFGSSTVVTAFSGSATPTVATLTRTNLPAGPLPITAVYSGDSISDGKTASATYTVVSKTPTLDFTSSTQSPQVGVPFTLTAKVQVNGVVVGAPPISGGVTIFESGVPIGRAVGTPSGLNTPTLVATLPFTALSFAPLNFTATFDGDPVYRSVSSASVSPVQQKAQTTLSLAPGPSLLPIFGSAPTFQCGQPTFFTGTLAFPQGIGLSNRVFSLNSMAADGSVRFIGSAATGTLVPSATTGTAQGSASFVVPYNTANVVANFSGDTFLRASSSPLLHVTMQPVPVSVSFVGLASTVTNPLTIRVGVANSAPAGCTVGGPEGTVQIFDGSTSLGVVAIPNNSLSPTQVLDGTSNTILLTETTKQVSLTVALPVGVHNLRAQYTGDVFHAAGSSAVVTVTAQ